MVCCLFYWLNAFYLRRNQIKMSKQIFFFAACFIFCLTALHGQVNIKQHHFEYKEIDAQNCYVKHMEYTYPVFYSAMHNLQPLNDSVRNILLNYTIDEKESSLAYLIANGIDTQITNADPVVNKVECDQPELIPDEGSVDYAILINNDQLLSFTVTSGYYVAGGSGHYAQTIVYPLCYDLKENKWLNMNALFS